MNNIWKKVKKWLIWISLIGLFLVTLTSIFLKVYEDDIEQYAVDEINKYLDVKVDVTDIDLSFLSNFPYVSLDFQKVLIRDNYKKTEGKDTLFYAKNLYLNFNVWDIWNNNYSVKRVGATKAVLKIKTTESGDKNYNILKPKKDSASDEFDFAVKLFSLKDFRFEYVNVASKQFYNINIEKGAISGEFSETEYQLNAESDLFINQLKTNSFSLISRKNANLDIALNINTINNEYRFTKGDLTIEEMPFHITGLIKSDFIDMNINGNDISLDNLSKSLLNESLEFANQYEGSGQVNFESAIKGKIDGVIMPSISAEFSIDNGAIKELEKNLSLTNLILKGHYQNEHKNQKEKLVFSELSLNLLGSHIEGSTEVIDFEIPTFAGEILGNLKLEPIHEFLNIESIESLKGEVVFNTKYAVKFADIQYNPSQFDIYNTTGNFNLKEITYQGKNDHVIYQNINGDVIVKGDDAAAKNISIHTQNSDLLINGALKNLIPFIEGTGQLGLIATLESDYILLDDFLGENKENANNTSEQELFELPDVVNLNLDLQVNKFDWDNHQFKNINGKLLMAHREVTIQHFNLKTLEGDIAGNLKISNYLEKGNSINGKLRFNGINVKKLFDEWDSFDQTTITGKNIVGNAKGNIDLALFFDEYFNVLTDKIIVNTHINIYNGELNNLAIMKDITEYMRSNKALKVALNKHIDNFEDKLVNIKFKEMANDILIKDGKIQIPRMNILSSAMDMTLSGWHDFDNQIDYHFSFRFRELKTIPEYTEFGKVEDDGLGWKIYLSMYGDLDDPSYKIDKDERKEIRQEYNEAEKESLKSILKSEIGLFGNDTTIKKVEKEKSEAVEFIMYDEEQELEELNPTKKKVIKKSANKKQTNKFFEKLKAAEEKERLEAEKESEEILE